MQRKEIYEELHRETKRGMRSGQTSKTEKFSVLETKSFVQDNAEKLEYRPEPQKYRSRHRHIWDKTTVCRILEDERYTGTCIMGKREAAEVGGRRSLWRT